MKNAWKIFSALAVVIGAIAACVQILDYVNIEPEEQVSHLTNIPTVAATLSSLDVQEQPTSAPAATLAEQTDSNPTLALPFSDTFDNGLNSQWRVISGSPLIDGGRLTAVEEVKIGIGNSQLENYTLQFTVEGASPAGCGFGYWHYLRLLVKPTVEFHFSRNDYNGQGVWSSLENGNWKDFNRFEQADCGQFRLVVNNGNYKLYINEVLYSDFTLATSDGSQLVITVNTGVLIDNLSITP